MTHPDDLAAVKAADRLAHSARAQAESRYTEEGAKALPGASNPYKPGSAAATWWQRGNSAATAAHAERIARAIHYPECWDTGCYRTVWDAMHEYLSTFACSNEACAHAPGSPA